MGTPQPVLLLDVDGVINACTRKPDRTIWKRWEIGEARGSGRTWPIAWSPEVVKFLTGLHDSGRVEIRWHTTWQHEAQNIADLVGLPVFPVAEAPEYADRSFSSRQIIAGLPDWWKLPAAERVVQQERRPLIWADDDISYSLRKEGKPYEVGTPDAPALLVSPGVSTGLCPRHLRQIDAFLTKLAEGRS